MKAVVVMAATLFGAGCKAKQDSGPPPPYNPSTFRADLELLIAENRYDAAVTYLGSASAVQQADYDKSGYLAVANDMIELPGVEDGPMFDPSRDSKLPGTVDAVEDVTWQETATRFAAKYNRRRQSTEAPLSTKSNGDSHAP